MILKRKDTGTEVLIIQELLRSLGYKIEVDGNFDLKTEAAVRMFQRNNPPLVVDGIVGPLTQNKLKKGSRCTPIPPIKVVHNVPYLSQRDNLYNPNGTCGPTSIAMVLKYLGMESDTQQIEDKIWLSLQTPDAQEYFKKNFPWAINHYSPHNIAGMLEWVVENEFNFKDILKQISITELQQLLLKGPCIVSTRLTGSGHIICLIGLTADNDFIVNDPFGNWQKGYNKDQNGEMVIYNKEDFIPLLKTDNLGNLYVHFIVTEN